MPRRFVAELQEHENIDQVFLVADKQLRANRQGNLFLQMRLSDKTGTLNTLLWNATEAIYATFENGDYLRVKGTTQIHNGSLQMIASKIEKANPRDVDELDFSTLNNESIEKMANRLGEILRNVRNVHLRSLAEAFLMDEAFMAKFLSAPAGVKNHHAYHGGLVEHVVSLMELSQLVGSHYPGLDSEQLLLGAFLHDLGKTEELTFERELGYSDEGQLIGHLVMGVSMLNEKVRAAEKLSGEEFPRELHLRLQHMIVSHHGEYEFGSPKVPMTLEAVALHFLDNLDAKLHNISQLMKEDMNSDSRWTPYHASLGRKLFKGQKS